MYTISSGLAGRGLGLKAHEVSSASAVGKRHKVLI